MESECDDTLTQRGFCKAFVNHNDARELLACGEAFLCVVEVDKDGGDDVNSGCGDLGLCLCVSNVDLHKKNISGPSSHS